VDELCETQVAHRLKVTALAQDSAISARTALLKFIDLFSVISWEMPEFSALLMQEVSNPGERLEVLNRDLVRPFIEAALPIVNAAIKQQATRASNPALFLQMLFSSIAVPLVAPAMRNDLDAGELLRNALSSEAQRMFVSDIEPQSPASSPL
jgi:hypothetical protein